MSSKGVLRDHRSSERLLPRLGIAALILVSLCPFSRADERQSPPPPSQPVDRPTDLSSETEREVLVERIRRAAEAAKAQQAPPQPATAPAPTPPASAPTQRLNLAPPPPDAPQPRFVLKQQRIEHPVIWQGQSATFNFDVENGGAGPLAIRVKSCCGLKIEGDPERLIQPGQKENLRLNVPAGSRQGTLTRRVTVLSNDRETPQAVLECVVEITTALRLDPPMLNFGSISRTTSELKRTVTITRGGGGPISPRVRSTGSPSITAEIRELVAGEKYELELIARPPWEGSALRGTVQLETGVSESIMQTMSVFGTILPRLAAVPQRFTLRVLPEEPYTESAYLTWDSATPGKVTGVTVSDPDLKVHSSNGDGRVVITVDVPAGYNPTRMTGHAVNVETDDPAAPTLRIPIFAVNRVAGQPPVPAPPTAAPPDAPRESSDPE